MKHLQMNFYAAAIAITLISSAIIAGCNQQSGPPVEANSVGAPTDEKGRPIPPAPLTPPPVK